MLSRLPSFGAAGAGHHLAGGWVACTSSPGRASGAGFGLKSNANGYILKTSSHALTLAAPKPARKPCSGARWWMASSGKSVHPEFDPWAKHSGRSTAGSTTAPPTPLPHGAPAVPSAVDHFFGFPCCFKEFSTNAGLAGRERHRAGHNDFDRFPVQKPTVGVVFHPHVCAIFGRGFLIVPQGPPRTPAMSLPKWS